MQVGILNLIQEKCVTNWRLKISCYGCCAFPVQSEILQEVTKKNVPKHVLLEFLGAKLIFTPQWDWLHPKFGVQVIFLQPMGVSFRAFTAIALFLAANWVTFWWCATNGIRLKAKNVDWRSNLESNFVTET
jgi:hypothetical protein